VRNVELPLAGVHDLHLVAHNYGGPHAAGAADWAGARVICQSTRPITYEPRTVRPAVGIHFEARYLWQNGGVVNYAFGMREAGHARCDLQDQNGRIIARLIDGYVPHGEYNFFWNPGSAQLNGVYFIVLTTDAGTWTRKVAALH
jgi:hypothetical protein